LDILLWSIIAFFAGIIPMVCWGMILWWFDRYEKEPVHLLVISFLWGVVPAVTLAVILEYYCSLPLKAYIGTLTTEFTFVKTSLLAPLMEESAKAIGLVCIFRMAQKEIDGPLDGIIYGAIVGFGFAATENVLYFLTSRTFPELINFIFLRALAFGSLHAMFTSFTGLGMALAKYSRRKRNQILLGLGGFGMSVVFHAFYNLGLSLTSTVPSAFFLSIGFYGMGMLFFVVLFIGSLFRERQTIKKYLLKYVDNGILTRQEWESAGSILLRLRSELAAIKGLDYSRFRKLSKLYNNCAELAFKEKQAALWGRDVKIQNQISAIIKDIQKI
jgi:RsiW-degrading membrane proteinase PrsW (M82 family)